jgi:transcription elongation factor Elf1
MSRSSYLKFNCPSCGHALAGTEPVDYTQVIKRTCADCGDRWQLVVKALVKNERMQVHSAVFVFIDNAFTRRQK